MKNEHGAERSDDALADSIAELWQQIDARAAAENNEETRKAEELILSWAGKLAEILKGPKE